MNLLISVKLNFLQNGNSLCLESIIAMRQKLSVCMRQYSFALLWTRILYITVNFQHSLGSYETD
jgi:hypothetical protein